MFGTPSRGMPVRVPRQLIFSSVVMSEIRLSMRVSVGRFGSAKGYPGCCATAGASQRAKRQGRHARWFFIGFEDANTPILSNRWGGESSGATLVGRRLQTFAVRGGRVASNELEAERC